MQNTIKLLFWLLLVAFQPCWAEPGFTPAETAELKKFGPKVVVAGYTPAGFKLNKVVVALDKRDGHSYQIKYQGPGKAEYTVQAAYGGIGDGPDGQPHPFKSPLFGKGVLNWIKPEAGGDGRSSVWSGWMHLPGKEFPVFALSGVNMDAKVAIKIVESFRLFK